MRCSSLHPTRWSTRFLPHGYLPTAAAWAGTSAAAGTNPAYQLAGSRSAAGRSRDWRRSNAIAAVMQVRPLSVVSGTAGSSPFVRSPFGTSGWL